VVDWGNQPFGAGTNPIVVLSDVVAVGAGSANGLALRSNGTLVPATSRPMPFDMPAGLSNVFAISCGGIDLFDHNLALRSDGRVVTWGNNSFGQTNVPAWLSNVVAISAGGWHNLALRKDGTVVSWGYNSHSQTNVPPWLNGVSAVEAGDYHSLAVRTNGTVVAWGLNHRGQANVPPGLFGIRAIAGGGHHSLALSTNGTVVAWGAGKNNSGTFFEYWPVHYSCWTNERHRDRGGIRSQSSPSNRWHGNKLGI
jgi:trimeric autotransporter adhesin